MIRNYLKIALRNMNKHKGYAFINVFGLAAGIACCMIIFLYVNHEFTYDRHHKDADRIYRVAMGWKVPVGEFQSANVNSGLAAALKENFTEVEEVARIMPLSDMLVQKGNLQFYEDRMVYADQEIFDLFTIPFIHGKPENALDRPWTVILTECMAEKYFGSRNPLGETIEIKKERSNLIRSMSSPESDRFDFEITGVVKNPPSNTHFKYDLILSLKQLKEDILSQSWLDGGSYTYIKLKRSVNPKDFELRIQHLADDYVGKQLKAWGQERTYFLQALTDIHFQSHLRNEMETPGNETVLYIYSVIGALVLLIGCMNFINLSNVRSVHRTKEVGLRKVIGSRRSQLVGQFLGESFLVTLMALLVACLFCRLVLPLFNETAGTTLKIADAVQPSILLALVGLVVFISLGSGGYPTMVLTAFKPTSILRGSTRGGKTGSTVIKALVVGQYTISIFLIICTVTVFNQLDFMKGGMLGFVKDQKIVLPFRYNERIRNHIETLKNELLNHHAIIGATASSSTPGRSPLRGYLGSTENRGEPAKTLNMIACDYDFIPEYGIKIIAGRPLQQEKNDAETGILINESAVYYLGYSTPEEAIGKRWSLGWYDGKKVTREIIGVTTDFHYQGMQKRVEPLFLIYNPYDFNALTLTLNAENMKETMTFIRSKWDKLVPSLPYEGYFLDADFDRQYRAEEQMSQLLALIAGMGLIIACLGLLGLASFMAQRRTKEIGIRKALGASVPQISFLLSREFTLWVLIANILTWPLAWYVTNLWLQNFAYRTHPELWIYLLSGLGTLAIAAFTVSFQAVKAATANPVDSLRYE